jgi:pilus assembly protein Flp/PilA
LAAARANGACRAKSLPTKGEQRQYPSSVARRTLFNRDVSDVTRIFFVSLSDRRASVTKFLQAGKASAARLVKAVNKLVTGKEEGATLAEYGLLLALIAVVCIAAITVLGTKISAMFVSVSTSI